ncbi:Beta-1,3-galactosyl-O-glycosyl-glycoprotein beta-1,6-N-acetylglucosaminyltransferase 3 [Aphelenchoides bicaudatus]|nr:Beta-1,3-galactosyl-O-glycosyl-glycoprotein beta-1,6-N-acetylglucosaminyltransferase 3 [Aphelenchoides bicaudatus]
MFKSGCFSTLFANSSAGYTRLPQESNTTENKRSNLVIIFTVITCVCLFLAAALFMLGYYEVPTFAQKLFKKEVYFKRPNATKHIPCHKFFEPEVNYSELAKTFRVTYKDPNNEAELPTDCDSIMKRNNFYMEGKEEKDFPLAYARNVYEDYRFLEMLLSTTYTPQNYYCYSVDGKASALFHKRINDLAKCFPNVYVTNLTLTMDSKGHNTNAHHMKCLEWLMKDNKNWKYVVLLQNYDVPLKTNQEMVQIFKWYNGTNDVSTQQRPQWGIGKFSFEALRLFKNSSRNKLVVDGNKPEMPTYRSLVQVSMSRQSIDFIFDNLDLTQAINNF